MDKPRRLDFYIDYIKQVKEGYDEVAQDYRDQKGEYHVSLPPYLEFVTALPDDGIVVELGCGSGYPVGIDLIERGLEYTGVDLSTAQIEIAQQEYEEHADRFVEAEMLDYLRQLDDDSVNGILSLFTIFHLPRGRHIDLFTEIKRVVQPGGCVLFTAHATSWEGVNDDWFGARMLWSNFSYRFYRVLLQELGCTELMGYRHVSPFQGDDEETYYLLYEF